MSEKLKIISDIVILSEKNLEFERHSPNSFLFPKCYDPAPACYLLSLNSVSHNAHMCVIYAQILKRTHRLLIRGSPGTHTFSNGWAIANSWFQLSVMSPEFIARTRSLLNNCLIRSEVPRDLQVFVPGLGSETMRDTTGVVQTHLKASFYWTYSFLSRIVPTTEQAAVQEDFGSVANKNKKREAKKSIMKNQKTGDASIHAFFFIRTIL